MADYKELQTILDQIKAQAGPRGGTYAGRVIGPQDTPQSIMGRTPMGEMESAGQVMSSLPIAAAGITVGRGLLDKLRSEVGERPLMGFDPRNVFTHTGQYQRLGRRFLNSSPKTGDALLDNLLYSIKDHIAQGAKDPLGNMIKELESELGRKLSESEGTQLLNAIREADPQTGQFLLGKAAYYQKPK